jgi:hypothetical protein
MSDWERQWAELRRVALCLSPEDLREVEIYAAYLLTKGRRHNAWLEAVLEEPGLPTANEQTEGEA